MTLPKSDPSSRRLLTQVKERVSLYPPASSTSLGDTLEIPPSIESRLSLGPGCGGIGLGSGDSGRGIPAAMLSRRMLRGVRDAISLEGEGVLKLWRSGGRAECIAGRDDRRGKRAPVGLSVKKK